MCCEGDFGQLRSSLLTRATLEHVNEPRFARFSQDTRTEEAVTASDALIAFSGTLHRPPRNLTTASIPRGDKTAFRSRLYQFPKNHKLVTGESDADGDLEILIVAFSAPAS